MNLFLNLFLLALVLLFAYGLIKIVIIAFEESMLWGLLIVLVFPAVLVFPLFHWGDERVRKPFFAVVISVGLIMVWGSLVS